jgi:hypothetical protein
MLIAGLVCLFVGWIVWIKTGDSFTTGIALLMMGISFFIRPLATGNEKQNLTGEHKIASHSSHKAA